MKDMGAKTAEGQLAAAVLDEYMKGFQERNPTLRVFSAHLHMDEATPHLYIDFIPFITGSKRGLETRVSLKKALDILGFKGGTRSNTERDQWVEAEKEQLAAIMLRHGIEWEKKGTHEKHLSVLDFEKKERAREVAELEIKKEELESENASFSEINEALHEQLIAVDDEIHNMQESIVQSKEEAEKARKQADRYQKRMNELAPMVKNMEQFAVDFSEDPDRVLPDAGTLESGRAYRDNKAKPTVQKMVKVMRSVYSAYLDVSRKYDNLKRQYDQTEERADNLSERFHVIYAENQELKEAVRDFERIKVAIGSDEAKCIIQTERQREQVLKEQRRTEKRKRGWDAR